MVNINTQVPVYPLSGWPSFQLYVPGELGTPSRTSCIVYHLYHIFWHSLPSIFVECKMLLCHTEVVGTRFVAHTAHFSPGRATLRVSAFQSKRAKPQSLPHRVTTAILYRRRYLLIAAAKVRFHILGEQVRYTQSILKI